jgi:4-hydroxybenzoate polyprenyltransferase
VSLLSSITAAVRLVHPAPTLAVTALSGALGAILLAQAGGSLDERWALTVIAVLGSQVVTGATNDLADRAEDTAAGRLSKPLVTESLSIGAGVWIASIGLAVQLAASLRLGTTFLVLGLVAVGSAIAYNLWLSRTPASVVPYVVSFGILPLWIAAGVGVEPSRVVAASLLVAPFAAAAHLANTLRDFDLDARLGSRNLAQALGRRTAHTAAVVLAFGVGAIVGLALLLTGGSSPVSLAFGAAGLVALIPGIGSVSRLWPGMLVAAVCWTIAWALATG